MDKEKFMENILDFVEKQREYYEWKEALRDPVILMLVWNYCLECAQNRKNA